VRLERVLDRTYRVRSKWGESRSAEETPALGGGDGVKDLFECALVLTPEIAESLKDSIRKVEESTGTRVEVRANASKVLGSTREAVMRARDEIEGLRDGKTQRRRGHTHFVVLPLAAGWIQEKVASLQEEISSLELPDLSDACMVNPERLHCVVCMLKLRSPESLSLARGALRTAGLEVLKLTRGARVVAKIGGINCLPETKPRSAVSVHLDVFDSDSASRGLLNSICAVVCKALQRAGVLDEDAMRQQQILRQGEFRPALHMTVVSAKAAGQPHFNAAVVLDRMCDYSVGSIAIDEIRLAKVDAFDASGFYHAEASISLGR